MSEPALPAPAPAPEAIHALPPVGPQDLGLYVHFPWCRRLCPYCDFVVAVGPFDGPAFTDAILAELEARAGDYEAEAPLRSIYFGGGTPSLWAPGEVGRVIEAARQRLGLRADAEITLEANPEDADPARWAAYREAGVTRLSLGVQSLDASELRFLGRVHRAEAAARAVALARAADLSPAVDLIFALPGQDQAAVARSLDGLLDAGPDHLAAYTLTFEPDTHLGRRAAAGRIEPLDDDAQADQMARLSARAAARGFHRYEVSAYAPPGRAAVHNSLYWVGAPYLGLGPGAHSYRPGRGPELGARRRENARDVGEWLAGAPPSFEERLDAETRLAERLIVGVRPRWGLDLAALAAELGDPTLEARLQPAVARLLADGLLVRRGRRLGPTERGFALADTVARGLLAAL
jgi:putative oxygen-independent coproporphyrinogen III oxidase